MFVVRSIVASFARSFDFSGRSDRLEHWTFLLFSSIIFFILYSVLSGDGDISPVTAWVVLFFFAWILLANAALGVRRLHDHGMSGALILAPIIGVGMISFAASVASGSIAFAPEFIAANVFLLDAAGKIVLAISMIYLSFLFVRPGQPWANRFGDPVE